MAEKVIKTVIQLRRDTEANLTQVAETLILRAGEPCVTLDGENAGRMKIGDGTTPWGQLDYTGGTDEPIPVTADQVTFDNDMVFTYQFGKYAPDEDTGRVTIPSNNKTLEELFTDAYAEDKNPNISKPNTSISSIQMKATEVGTTVTPAYTTTFNKGSYEFGPDTGITATSYSVVFNEETLTTSTGSFTAYQVTDDTNMRIQSTVAHSEGAVPLTALGAEYAEGKIAAGSVTSQTGALTGYRAYFYGVLDTSSSEAPLTSAIIRGLTNGGNLTGNKTLTISAHDGAKRIVIAIPNSNSRNVTSAILTTSMNADITAEYVKQANVDVEGVASYSAVPYKVWVYEPASIDASEKHSVTIS